MGEFPIPVGATDEEEREVELQRPTQGSDVPLVLTSLLSQWIPIEDRFIGELVLVLASTADANGNATTRRGEVLSRLGVPPNATGAAIATEFPHLL